MMATSLCECHLSPTTTPQPHYGHFIRPTLPHHGPPSPAARSLQSKRPSAIFAQLPPQLRGGQPKPRFPLSPIADALRPPFPERPDPPSRYLLPGGLGVSVILHGGQRCQGGQGQRQPRRSRAGNRHGPSAQRRRSAMAAAGGAGLREGLRPQREAPRG